MFRNILRSYFSDPDGGDAQAIKTKQVLRLGFIMSMGVVFILFLVLWRSTPKTPELKKAAEAKTVMMASDSLDLRDKWSQKMMEKTDSQVEKMDDLLLSNKILQERMDALEAMKLDSLKEGDQNYNGPLSAIPDSAGASSPSLSGIPGNGQTGSYEGVQGQPFKSEKPKMSYVTVEAGGPSSFHADHYVVSGTYSQAVLMSGLAVSTAVASQSNPQPIAIRLLDLGNLPRGWKSKIKDAVLIGSCYGDLSSERAMCRINKLSFTEADGTGVEIKVEGWVYGEDGAPGIRGKVVDRAGEVARESLFAGILGGMANFLQAQANNTVHPVSPFGQTNAMSSDDMLKGAAGSGASNALDKLAEFSIKRAESMQPVIMIHSGRSVDVLFKEGFSLKPNVGNALKVRGNHE
jgi:conjugal transfer pilus assembly protein TraB